MKPLVGLLLLVFLFVVACNEKESTPENTDGDMDSGETFADGDSDEMVDNGPPDDEACNTAIVTGGFGLGWRDLNHRISWFKVQPIQPDCAGAMEEGTLDVGFIGGDFSTGDMMNDYPFVRYRHEQMTSPNLGFFAGTADMELFGPEHEAEGSVTVDLDDAKLGGFDEYVAFINGIELNTRVEQLESFPEDYNADHGYTSQGIGAWVGPASFDEGELNIDFGLRFDHGPADRDNMNRAMRVARTECKLHYLVVGVEAGEILPASVSYRMEYPHQEHFQDTPLDHAPYEERLVSVEAAESHQHAFPGWTSFNFVLDPDATASEEFNEPIGYYIREYAISATVVDRAEGAKKATLDVDGYVSNATGGIAVHRLVSDFTGEVAVVFFDEGMMASGLVQEEFETGEASFPLSENVQ